MFPELCSLFVKISVFDTLSLHDLFSDISEFVTPELKELEQLKNCSLTLHENFTFLEREWTF